MLCFLQFSTLHILFLFQFTNSEFKGVGKIQHVRTQIFKKPSCGKARSCGQVPRVILMFFFCLVTFSLNCINDKRKKKTRTFKTTKKRTQIYLSPLHAQAQKYFSIFKYSIERKAIQKTDNKLCLSIVSNRKQIELVK